MFPAASSISVRPTRSQFLGAAGALLALGIALGPFPLGIAVALSVVAALLPLIRPEIAVYLLVASVPLQDIGSIPVAGTNLTGNKLATGLAVAVLVAGFLSGQLRLRLRSPALAPVLAYLAVMWISMLVARSIEASLAEIYRWLQFLLVMVLAASTLTSVRQWLALASIGALSGAAEGALGLYQFLTGSGPASFAITEELSRAFGTFGMPNSYAGYLVQVFPVTTALLATTTGFLLSKRSQGRRLPTFVAWLALATTTGLTAAGLLASYSRGAWLGTLVGLGVMLLAVSRRLFLATLLALSLALGTLWIQPVQLLPEVLQERVSSVIQQFWVFDVTQAMVTPSNFAVAERMSQWQAGINMFLNNPLLGVGIGNYNAAYPDYFVGIWRFSRGHAHNYYINAAAETGAVGLAVYLWLLGYWFLSLAKACNLRHGVARGLAVGALGAVAALAVHNLVDNLHVLSMGVYQGTLYALGMIFSDHRFKEEA